MHTGLARGFPRGRFLARHVGLLASAALVSLLITPVLAAANSISNSKIALHVQPAAINRKAVCTTLSPLGRIPPLPCSQFTTKGAVGQAYDVYLVVGQSSSSGVAGVSMGVSYDGEEGRGIDVFSWKLCSNLEFSGAGWPGSGTGNRITWAPSINCQTHIVNPDGVHAVAGVFYVIAYSPDYFVVTKNMSIVPPEIVVADCAGAEADIVNLNNLGRADFSVGSTAPGYNPCGPSIGVPEGGLESGDLLLAQNLPNPVLESTRITYTLSEASEYARLRILDIQGRIVKTLVEGANTPGPHTVVWDGADDRGRRVAPGMYLYRLETPRESRTRRLLVLH